MLRYREVASPNLAGPTPSLGSLFIRGHPHFLISSGDVRLRNMTVISVEYSDVIDLLGKRYSIDEIRSAVSMIGAADEGIEGEMLSFDVSPNRPDMYSVEGIVRSLRGVLGLETGLPRFETQQSDLRFIVDPSVNAVRPYAVGGIVSDIEMNDGFVKSLMDLQEKLHATIGRRRKKVAIGIHDLDKVKRPFTYRAAEPESVRFVPLGLAEPLSLAGILEKHEKGREFAHILEGKQVYPIIEDAEGTVLSFPPIINGITTALTKDTRNLFIDVTGLDFNAVNSALTILSTSLYERGGKIESVTLELPNRMLKTPDLSPRAKSVSVANSNRLLGLSLSPQEAVQCLERMRLGAKAAGGDVEVLIPAYRIDVLHEVDLIEDIAVGYGYDRMPLTLAKEATIGTPAEMAVFSQTLREIMTGYGYQEIMSLSMVDPEVPFRGGASGPAIVNPVSTELRAMRSSLLPSLLKLLALNTHRDLPQRVFEVEDVLVGGSNEKHLAGSAIHAKASFTEVKSLVQSLFRDLGLDLALEASEDPNFIPGRCASALSGGKSAGIFGEISPAILEAYGLAQPVIAFEMNAASLRSNE